jgi:hypothetical protein
MENLSFKLKLEGLPVSIEKSDGTKVEYNLKELNSEDRKTFVAKMDEVFGNDYEKATSSQVIAIQTELLTRTLYDENDVKMTDEKLKSWPATAMTALFEAAQSLSNLTDRGVELLKEQLYVAAKKYADSKSQEQTDENKQAILDLALTVNEVDDSKNR